MSRVPCLHLRKYSHNGLLGAIKSIHLEETGKKTSLPHSHDYYELIVVVQGDGKHIISNQEIPLKRGQVFLIPPVVHHNFSNFQQIILQNFMFGRRTLRLAAPMLRTLPNSAQKSIKQPLPGPIAYLDGNALTELDLLLNSIELEDRQFSPGKELAVLAHFVQLMSVVFLNSAPDASSKLTRDNKIDNAIVFMQRNYDKTITLADLSRKTFMAPVTLIQHFRKEFHTTPMQWLMKLRLHHACRLLLRSDLSMSEVAQKCGFNDPLYFSRQFHRILGCTPKDFRQHGLGQIQVSVENDIFLKEIYLDF